MESTGVNMYLNKAITIPEDVARQPLIPARAGVVI